MSIIETLLEKQRAREAGIKEDSSCVGIFSNPVFEMSQAQKNKREEIVLAMKADTEAWREKYGEKWLEVMYATATKMAMES